MAVTQAIPMTRHPYADGSYKKMLIDGKWIDAASGKRFETHNPATGELLATVAEGDAEDINRAVAAARRAFEGPWSKVKPYERQACCSSSPIWSKRISRSLSQPRYARHGRADQPHPWQQAARARYAQILCGAGDRAARGDHRKLAARRHLFLHAEGTGRCRRRDHSMEWPVGASVWKIGPAIATGCTVILKPAEEAPLTSLRLGELAMEAGIPPGVVNVVPGYGETAGAALASHPGVDKVAFTGSHVTGQSIVKASAGNLKRVVAGTRRQIARYRVSPMPISTRRCRVLRWRCSPIQARSAAQARGCSSSIRLYDEFVGRVAEYGKKLQVGNGLDPNHPNWSAGVRATARSRHPAISMSAARKAPRRWPAAPG